MNSLNGLQALIQKEHRIDPATPDVNLSMRALAPNLLAQVIDAECAVPLVRASETTTPGLRAAISSSFAFSGTNVVLAFSRA